MIGRDTGGEDRARGGTEALECTREDTERCEHVCCPKSECGEFFKDGDRRERGKGEKFECMNLESKHKAEE